MSFFSLLEHLVFSVVVGLLVAIWYRKGGKELARYVVLALKEIPGVEEGIALLLRSEATKFVRQAALTQEEKATPRKERVKLPEKGVPVKELKEQLVKLKSAETPPTGGTIFAYTYQLPGDQLDMQKNVWQDWEEMTSVSVDHEVLAKEFRDAFLHENALNPMIYPSLRKMETEIVSMAAHMLHGDEKVVGFLTSGGTESVLMAIKTYRDRARKLFPHIKEPNMVAPHTIHPCHMKACHYFGVTMVLAPTGPDHRVDVKAMEKLIDSNTILLAASAPQFPHGIVDDIEKVAHLAKRRGLPLHIDSCFGGFMLPWVEKLGHPVPKFDFRNPGVTSISADAHKWGYCCKGASVILYRNEEYRKHQIFSYSTWCGGLYGSPSMAGTRPAGNIASTWATMKYLGEEGYMDMARQLMDTTNKIITAVNNTPGLCIIGKPHMNAFAIGSSDPEINIQVMCDILEKKGYKPERQSSPDCMHLSILPQHIANVDKIIKAFQDSAKEAKGNRALLKEGTAAMYGMMATVPDKSIISDFIVSFFSELYK